jgi:hypothetical protein
VKSYRCSLCNGVTHRNACPKEAELDTSLMNRLEEGFKMLDDDWAWYEDEEEAPTP